MTEPLLVLNALVLRADSSPSAGTRAARPNYNVNRAGQGIEEAGVGDRTPALSREPQFEWEAFDEYWRKTHGPKIVHSEPGDTQTSLLQFYLQQHRIPAGPCSGYAPPYGAGADADGQLPRDPAARCAPHRRPAWDGIAQLGYRTRAELESFFSAGPGKYGEKIMPDEAVFLRGFGFHVAEEHEIVQRGDRRRDPIVLLKLHTRTAGTSREAFRGRWMAQHAALLREQTAARPLRRYVQLVNVSRADEALYDPIGDRIDGIGVYSFANMNDCEDFVASEAHAALVADEAAFAPDTSFFTTLNYVIRDLTC